MAGPSDGSTPRPQGKGKKFSPQMATKNSGPFNNPPSGPGTPSNLLPSRSPPEGSIGLPSSTVRQRPRTSKFSREKPTGSIKLWQLAQTALARCSERRSRTERLAETVLSLRAGTFGSGGGGGVPRIFSSTQRPRMTGEVRFAYEVTVRTLPWRSNPPRALPGSNDTRRKRLPYTYEMP